jgi:hypothetical protein
VAINNEKCFSGDDDYKIYLDRLEHYRAKFHVRIYAYCLISVKRAKPVISLVREHGHRVGEVANLLRSDQENISMMLLRSSAREGKLIV